MTSPFPSLVRLNILSVYAPARRGARRGARKAGARPTAKEVWKKVGMALLFLVSFGQIVGLYGYMSFSSYNALKGVGLQGLTLLNATISATVVAFVLCFLTALSTYCSSKADTNMLALPIEGRDLLGAKMAMVYLADFALAFLIMACAVAVYAVKEAPPAGFYVGALLSCLAIPLPPLAAVYLVTVPLISAARPLRNKNVVMVLGGLVAIAFSLGLNYYFQTNMSRLSDQAWVVANYAGPDSLIIRIGKAYPPSLMAWRSMTAPGAAGPLYGLAVLALGLAAAVLVALAFGPMYAKSLLGFDERRIKRVAATRDFLSRKLRRRPALAALFLREWRLMNREPVYFMNGPMIIFLMPVMIAFGVLVTSQKRDAVRSIGPLLEMWRGTPWPMLIAAALGAFLGSSTSITCTALSRDAKALRYLKALPMSYRDFMLAKFLHGFAFALIGTLVGAVGGAFLFRLAPVAAAGAALISLAFSALACICGLWLDTASPRLSWDAPIAAMKQNPNSVIVILAVMALIALLGIASAGIHWGSAAFFALYFGGFSALAAAALAAYPRFAKRKLEEIEA
jgi:ABC-2 type transport system permease protein